MKKSSTAETGEELVARAIHRVYLEQRVAHGEQLGSTPSTVEWDGLPDEFKNSSREQGRHTQKLLGQLGYTIRPAQPGLQRMHLRDEEVEELARLAHERWLEERRRSGWRLGSPRDDDHRLHPDLVAWDELGDDRREIDRYMMRELPRVLDEFGLVLVRRSRTSRR